LEYGSSNPLDRNVNLPLELLQQLACNMGRTKEWVRASDVLSALVLRCEQHLPLCHPTTLCAMLDLAGALTESDRVEIATSVLGKVIDMLSSFLSDLESLFFDQCYARAFYEDNPNQVVFFDENVDAVSMMQAFTSNLRTNLSREFLKILGPNHRISLLNHSLVGDACSVLGNCLSAGEKTIETNPRSTSADHGGNNGSGYFWALAFSHYELALKGWTKVESLSHPNAASAAYSVARCLRELGKLDQALKILETLASCLEQKLDLELMAAKTGTKEPESYSQRPTAPTSNLSFLPRHKRHVSSPQITYRQEQTSVLCFWMMAVLTVEHSPDERGRSRALSLLHTASMTLQRALANADMDDQTRVVCLDLYAKVEAEALDIFEPLQNIPIPDSQIFGTTMVGQDRSGGEKGYRQKKAPWEIVTPMREKRQWTSPREKRFADSNKDHAPIGQNKAVVQMV